MGPHFPWSFSAWKNRERGRDKLTLTSWDLHPALLAPLQLLSLTQSEVSKSHMMATSISGPHDGTPDKDDLGKYRHTGFYGEQNCRNKHSFITMVTFHMVCRGHHGDELVYDFTWLKQVGFIRKGAAWLCSGHSVTPAPSSRLANCLLLLSSFALTWSTPPYFVLLRKCASAGKKLQHQCWAGFKAGGRRGWCALCMASYTAAEIYGIHTDM